MGLVRDFINQSLLPKDSCIFLDEVGNHRNLPYSTLLHVHPDPILPDAVLEVNGQPFLYLLQQDWLASAAQSQLDLAETLRALACRADARFLGVIEPGKITIYPIHIAGVVPDPVQTLADTVSGLAIRDFLSGMAWPSFNQGKSTKAEALWLEAFLLKLLNNAAETLRESFSSEVLTDASVLSLIGRALFSRFLTDRRIVSPADVYLIAPQASSLSELYATPANAVATFHWLDRTFNGDLLPICPAESYEAFFERLGGQSAIVCRVLSDIQYGAIAGQMELGWQGLRFKHIPVDVLSQVYENFYHKFVTEQAKSESVHYTPRYLAQLLIDGAFAVVPQETRHVARILDPAAGAGIFLVLALRRLVQEHWRATGQQPDRRIIRHMLDNQLCGLDINPEALKVAALSLYLAALDLDPAPQPLSDLAFHHLHGKVLHCVNDAALGVADTGEPHALGSLSPLLKSEYPDLLLHQTVAKNRPKFDIVIGNPPWTTLKGKMGAMLERVVRDSVAVCGLPPVPETFNLLRHQAPDQPFLWKAMRWTVEGGAIALLLHARLLFLAESQPMRELLFRAVRVTGILNGTALRQTMVWPNVSAQFCLLVAKNEPPQAGDCFHYLNPHIEPGLNELGLFRIDPQAAVPVPCEMVGTTPTLFKTLFRGNGLDLELVRRLSYSPMIHLGTYLEELGTRLTVGYGRRTGEEKLPDTSFLVGLKNLTARPAQHYIVQTDRLPDWEEIPPRLRWPRSRDIYSAPLLLFREAAKLDFEERGALLCPVDVAYSESFFGISFKGCAHAEGLTAYLYVLSYSSLFVYFQLMSSSKFGVERETFHKEDYEKFPLLPWHGLKPAQ